MIDEGFSIDGVVFYGMCIILFYEWCVECFKIIGGNDHTIVEQGVVFQGEVFCVFNEYSNSVVGDYVVSNGYAI